MRMSGSIPMTLPAFHFPLCSLAGHIGVMPAFIIKIIHTNPSRHCDIVKDHQEPLLRVYD